jgi:serine/threonine protein kinase
MNLAPNSSFGQYRIIRLLGRGGMGEVYEVEHTTLGRRYAIKLLPADFAARPEAMARFRREARVMANLEHRHIVRVDEFGETEGRHWLRMELVKGVGAERGGLRMEVRGPKSEAGGQRAAIRDPKPDSAQLCVTLGDYAAQHEGRIGEEEFVLILQQLLQALAYAHGKGVVHRDLKPGNILLDKDSQGRLVVRVSDFGLARVIGDEFIRSQARLSLSRSLGTAKTLGGEASIGGAKTVEDEKGSSTRALLGTWEYMSPEQQRGEDADARSDIYAVGLMCYRLLTGRELGLKKPSQLVEGLQPAWDSFIIRAMEQDPAARYPSSQEMLEGLTPVSQAIETSRQLRRQMEEERRRQEEQAARERAEEEAARARGEEWALGEERAARAWQAQSEREFQEQQQRAAVSLRGRKPGQLLQAGATLKFACPHCAQHLQAERAMAHRDIACPACAGQVIVPVAPAVLAKAPEGLQRAFASRRVRLAAAVGVVSLALVGAGAWLLWSSFRGPRQLQAQAQAPESSNAPPATTNQPRQTTSTNQETSQSRSNRPEQAASSQSARQTPGSTNNNPARRFQITRTGPPVQCMGQFIRLGTFSPPNGGQLEEVAIFVALQGLPPGEKVFAILLEDFPSKSQGQLRRWAYNSLPKSFKGRLDINVLCEATSKTGKKSDLKARLVTSAQPVIENDQRSAGENSLPAEPPPYLLR